MDAQEFANNFNDIAHDTAMELLRNNDENSVIEAGIEYSISGVRMMKIEYRLKLFASLQMNFNLETGEEL